jgi:hypothetical protein
MITGGTIGVICKALKDAFQELKDTGTVSSSRLATRDDITSLLGLAHVYELEQAYGVAEAPPVSGAVNR